MAAGPGRCHRAVPISLGDSHKGHRVVGTTTDFFARYKYRNETPLAFSEGEAFADLFDVVIGVAEEQGYKLGDGIILTHGLGDVSFSGHDNRLSGLLAFWNLRAPLPISLFSYHWKPSPPSMPAGKAAQNHRLPT